MTQYLVIYRTVSHVAYVRYDDLDEARQDEHLGTQWSGRLYSIDDGDGFAAVEAKDLYNHGVEAMAPGWGIAEIEDDAR